MDLSFGARLRAQRERQQVALATIAEQTKIRISLLDGLERDDVAQWPGGVFRRSYFRSYAQAIGLEPEALLREFLELYPDPFEEVPPVEAVARTASGEAATRRPPTRLRFLIGSAMGVLPTRRAHVEQRVGPVTEVGGVVLPLQMAPAEASDRVAPSPAVAAEPSRPATEHPVAHEAESGRHAASPQALPATNQVTNHEAHTQAPPREIASSAHIDLSSVADLCTSLARAGESGDVVPVLERAAGLLDAVGVILWMWDPGGDLLRAAVSHGYSDELLAQVPGVPRDSDNAIAAAFRTSETRIVNGGEGETGAIAVPLTTPRGSSGVLAVELRDGGERRGGVRAVAEILAAQLSTLIGYPPLVHAVTA